MRSSERKVWRSSYQREQDKALNKATMWFLAVVGGLLLGSLLLTLAIEYRGVVEEQCGGSWTGTAPRYSCTDVGRTQAMVQSLWGGGGDAVAVRHPLLLWLARLIFAGYALAACWLVAMIGRSAWRRRD